MQFTDIDVQIARQRYDDELRHARLLRLIREANAQPLPAASASPRSLLARVWSRLFARPALRRDTALR